DEVESVFQTKGCLRRFETDFQQLFPKIHPKYSKRTSSAIWDDSHDIFGSKSSLNHNEWVSVVSRDQYHLRSLCAP
ncbi:unnamed protein product, partial [Medioppia subpectinata]